jgi:hypothetical protein
LSFVDAGGARLGLRLAYTTSVSTFNDAGENPFFHQQQVVARIATP